MKVKRSTLYDYILGALVILSCTPMKPFRFLWDYTLIISVVWLLLRVIAKRYHPSKIIYIFMVFFGVNILFTFLNKHTVYSYTDSVLTLYMRVFLYTIWVDYSIKKDKSTFLDTYFCVTGALYLLQLFFQIFDQARFGVALSGNHTNLIQSDNFLGYLIVPFMVLTCVRSRYKSGRLTYSSFFMLIACCLSIIKSQSGSGMVGVLFFMVTLLYFEWVEKWNKRKTDKKTSIWKYYIIYFAFFIMIVFFNMQYLASDFLENVLHKDITFTGRTAIWAVVLDMIKKNPFWGYGTMPDGKTLVVSIALASGSFHSAHNYFLALLLETGIWGLLVYFYMLTVVARQIFIARDRYLTNIFGSGILAMFLMYISEGMITQTPQYLIFILAYYSMEWRKENIPMDQLLKHW